MLNLLPSAWKFRRAGTLAFAARKECLVPWGRRPAAQQPRCLLASLAAPRQSSWEGEEPTQHQQMQKSKIPKKQKTKKKQNTKSQGIQKIQKSKNTKIPNTQIQKSKFQKTKKTNFGEAIFSHTPLGAPGCLK